MKSNGTIAFEQGNKVLYGDVRFFLSVNGTPHALVSMLRLTSDVAALPQLKALQSRVCPFFPASAQDPLALVSSSKILGPCITIRQGSLKHFVMRLVNHHELRF